VQSYYLNQLRDKLPNQTQLVRFTFEIWDHALALLNKNDPDYLIGYNDWATKRWLLEEHAKHTGYSIFDQPCQDIEYEYHTLQFGKQSLFQFLEKSYDFPMSIPSRLVYQASIKPPQNTRALARACAVDRFKDSIKYSADVTWDNINFFKYQDSQKSRIAFLRLNDPRKTYLEDLKDIIDDI
jgi:hypothetical protein